MDKWHQENREYCRAVSRAHYQANKEERKAYHRAHYAANRERITATARRRTKQAKQDHVNGGGRKQFKETGMGNVFYCWLKKQGYPKDGYQVLCFNCNSAKSILGTCPHQSVPLGATFAIAA